MGKVASRLDIKLIFSHFVCQGFCPCEREEEKRAHQSKVLACLMHLWCVYFILGTKDKAKGPYFFCSLAVEIGLASPYSQVLMSTTH